MSSLSKQLQTISNKQKAAKVSPHQQQPTLVLDPQTARTVSTDLIYTMAVLAYSKLCQQAKLRKEGDALMSNQYRDINRNTLNKEQNRVLSQKITKFLLKLSPYFLSQQCRKILQYLLHNFKINIFQAEPTALIYLQYWNSPLYGQLVKNIPEKIINTQLSFLKQILSSRQPINFTYIVKSLAYSHQFMSSLVVYCLEYLRYEGQIDNLGDIEINIGEEYHEKQQKLPRCDPRKFLLQIFSGFIDRKINSCYKYILEFCGKAIHSTRTNSFQTYSLVMFLVVRMVVQDLVQPSLVSAIVDKILKTCRHWERKELRSIFDFVMIVWQRKAKSIKKGIVLALQQWLEFVRYLQQSKCSVWTVFNSLLQLWSEGVVCRNLLTAINVKIKHQQIYALHSDILIEKIVSIFETIVGSTLGDSVEDFVSFLNINYAHQIATFYNGKKVANKKIQEELIKMFGSNLITLNKSIATFQLHMIPIKNPSQARMHKPSGQMNQQSQEQSEKSIVPEKQTKPSISIYSILKSKGCDVQSIDYKDTHIRQILLNLLAEYYQQQATSKLSQQQKNDILEHYISQYTTNWLKTDLQNHDFITAIKFLSQIQNIEYCKICLLHAQSDINLVDDVLYRELARISLKHLSSNTKVEYKQTIYFINTLFKRLTSKYVVNNPQKSNINKLSQLLLKISEEIFKSCGVKKGKYQRLIHNHGRVVTEMILQLKSKRTVTKELNEDERVILDHYSKIIKIFGKENLYLLNIGMIQMLTRKDMDYASLKYFVGKVILNIIKNGGISFNILVESLVRLLVFCSQLGSIVKIDEEQIEPSLKSGIAKVTITQFFGLIKQKMKRVIIKKIFLFIKTIFQNTQLVQYFKTCLVEMSTDQLQQVIAVFTQFYRAVTSLDSQDAKIFQFKENILEKVTNLFPLQLRLTLYEPLLPNQHLYKYLALHLTEHSPEHSQFQALARIVNISPEEVTYQWVNFLKECMKRGNQPSSQLIQELINRQGNPQVYGQLICQISDSFPQLLYPHLPRCIEIIEKLCENAGNFTLAVITKVIINLGQIIEPYLSNLAVIGIEIDSPYIGQFVQSLASHLVPPTLIKLVIQIHKKIKNIDNFSLLFKEVVQKGVGSSLNKTLLALMHRTLTEYLHQEQDFDDIAYLQSQIFLNISLKMNENQLRKLIIDLIRWSESKSEKEQSLPFNLRKINVAYIYHQLTRKMESLFLPFYGYLFQSLLKDYQSISEYVKSSKAHLKAQNIKRSREENSQYKQYLISSYLSKSLACLQSLFSFDSEHDFMDSIKVDALSDPIVNIVSLIQFKPFTQTISGPLTSCLVALHRSIVDDFQMKTFNYKILLLLKTKNHAMYTYIFELVNALIESLQDRFLILVGDLVPFLVEHAGSRQEGISKAVRGIIAKIEELSGQQITTYTK